MTKNAIRKVPVLFQRRRPQYTEQQLFVTASSEVLLAIANRDRPAKITIEKRPWGGGDPSYYQRSNEDSFVDLYELHQFADRLPSGMYRMNGKQAKEFLDLCGHDGTLWKGVEALDRIQELVDELTAGPANDLVPPDDEEKSRFR